MFMFIPSPIALLILLFAVESNAQHARFAKRRPFPHHAARDDHSSTPSTEALKRPHKRAVSGWDSVGCVTDGSARALTSYSYNDFSLTMDKCINSCAARGYVYAGTQYGYQCYCGNSLSNGLGQLASTSSCSSNCYGDSSVKCGGPYRLTLYRKADALNMTSMGCYRDGSTRVMTGASTSSNSLSLYSCATFCSGNGFGYFGTQNGNQCFCSADALSESLLTSDSACSVACAAQDGTVCGGPYRLSVYSIQKAASASTTALSSSTTSSRAVTSSSRSSTTSNVASTTTTNSAAAPVATLNATSSVTALGCYSDSPTSRLLTGPSQTVDTNTVSSCAAWCASQGYAISGVKYSSSCFCGTTYSDDRKVADSQCNMACSGGTGICGGVSAMNLYRLTVSTASTSVRTSTSASPTATPSASVSLVPGWNSLGCYKDGSGASRLLTGAYRSDSTLTIDSCGTWCLSQGFNYIGLEYGMQCYCGSNVTAAAKVDDSRCTMNCYGDSTVKCGGAYLANVYTYVPSSATSTSASASKTTSSPTTTTLGCNAACTSQVGVPSIPASSTKQLWAHHMVGNTYSYTNETWRDDISQAASAGFDGFALNHGSSDWQFDRINDAYAVASSLNNFKLFLSIDVTAIGCASTADAQTFANIVTRYSNFTAQATYKNKVLVSTFSGEWCSFGQGSAQPGWTYVRSLIKARGVDIYLVPAIFSDPSTFSSTTWFDGLLNWDSAWPIGADGANALTTASDVTWLANLGNRTYMPSISPLFFTYYGPNSWNKNWIYRGDDWLLARRFEQLISMRTKVDMAEMLTWNDYGESHYVGPIRADQPNSQGWVDGFPHTSWYPLINFYSTAFRTGSYPKITSDQLWLWTRPHFKAANATAPTLSRPTNWQYTEDNLYAFVLLASPATVTIWSGGNYGQWNLAAGVNKLSVASATGTIGARISRNGKVVKTLDTEGQFEYTDSPVDYNYNYWVTAM